MSSCAPTKAVRMKLMQKRAFVASAGFLPSVQTSLAIEDGDTIHFLVTASKQPHYLAYCNETVLPDDPVSIIQQYTEHTSDLYSTINLRLAADAPALDENGEYIQALRGAVLQKPLLDDCLLYRGVDLSQKEVDHMEALGRFFIPSFTSTSIDSTKAYSKSHLLVCSFGSLSWLIFKVIQTGFCSRYACSITAELSNYYNEEREVLLACYSAFNLQRIEKVNSQTVVSLYLNEYGSSCAQL